MVDLHFFHKIPSQEYHVISVKMAHTTMAITNSWDVTTANVNVGGRSMEQALATRRQASVSARAMSKVNLATNANPTPGV